MTATYANTLDAWAARWGVPYAALVDLRDAITGAATPEVPGAPVSEAGVLQALRIEASQKGMRLWRNNVGAMQDESGRVVRFGLANDSAATNRVVKSGDLIGIDPILITPAHVGTTIGQFVSREAKRPGWVYSGDEREVAQAGWATLINSLGGNAGFATGMGTL